MWEDIFGKKDKKDKKHKKDKKDKKKGRKNWWDDNDEDDDDWSNNGWKQNDEKEWKFEVPEKVKPYLYLARELIIDAAEAHAMPQMIFWMKTSSKLHQYHHQLCTQMPTEFDSDEAELQFKNEKPLVAFACAEKARTILNYAAFALMLPALNEHKKFKTLMWMLQYEGREERAIAQANTVADFHLNINI